MALTDNLAGYWKLDEASGNRADSSGLGSILFQATGATINSRTGKVVSGVDLVRADSNWLRCASNSNVALGDVDWTIAGWAWGDDFTGSCVIIDKDNGLKWDVYLSCPNGTFYVYVDYTTIYAELTWSGGPVAVNTWHFFVVVHDSVNNILKLSVDNGTFVTAATTGVAESTAGNFNIGAQSDGTGRYDGIIDEVGIWKRVLTPAEITTLYNGGAGLTYPFVTTLAGYRSPLAFWMGGASAGISVPVPEIPIPAHGAGMSNVAQYKEALRQQAIALDDEEILLILSECIGVIE